MYFINTRFRLTKWGRSSEVGQRSYVTEYQFNNYKKNISLKQKQKQKQFAEAASSDGRGRGDKDGECEKLWSRTVVVPNCARLTYSLTCSWPSDTFTTGLVILPSGRERRPSIHLMCLIKYFCLWNFYRWITELIVCFVICIFWTMDGMNIIFIQLVGWLIRLFVNW